jgi:WD40 repeat protein/uncharacterized caspase-like protein
MECAMRRLLLVLSLASLLPICMSAQAAEIVPQTGHASEGVVAAIVPDRSFMVSGDANGKVKLWDLKGLREAKNLEGIKTEHANIMSLSLSNDGSVIAAATFKGFVGIWRDAGNGKFAFTLLKGSGDKAECLVSPDGKIVASTDHSSIVISDSATGKQIGKLPIPPYSGIPSKLLGWGPGAKSLVLGVKETMNGNEVGILDIPSMKYSNLYKTNEYSKEIQVDLVSPDSASLYCGCKTGELLCYDLASRKLKWTVKAGQSGFDALAVSPDSKHIGVVIFNDCMKVLGAADGTAEYRNSQTPDCLSFSADGRSLLGGMTRGEILEFPLSGAETDQGRLLYKSTYNVQRIVQSGDGRWMYVETGSSAALVDASGWNYLHGNFPSPIAVALQEPKDGGARARLLAVLAYSWSNKNNMVSLFDFSLGGFIGGFSAPGCDYLAMSPDGRFVAAYGISNAIIHDVETGLTFAPLVAGSNIVFQEPSFSADGGLMALPFLGGSSSLEGFMLIRSATGEVLATVSPPGGLYSNAALSADDRLVAAGLGDGGIGVWEIAALSGNVKAVGTKLDSSGKTRVVAFAKDGTLYAGGSSMNVEAWNPATKTRSMTYGGLSDKVYRMQVDESLGMIAAGGESCMAACWKIGSPSPLKSMKATAAGKIVSSVAISPDGKYLRTSNYDYEMAVHEISSGKQVSSHRAQLKPNKIHGSMFAPSGRYLDAEMNTSCIRFRSPTDPADSVSVYVSEDQNGSGWLMLSSDGYFDGSSQGSTGLGACIGRESFQVDQLAPGMNRPDILIDKLGFADSPYKSALGSASRIRLSRYGILAEKAAEAPLSAKPVLSIGEIQGSTVSLTVTRPKGYASGSSLRFWMNGVPVEAPGSKKAGAGNAEAPAKLRIELALIPGINLVEAAYVSPNGRESLRTSLRVPGPAAAERRLYVAAVGVSIYADPALNLQYAAKDAQDVAAIFSGMEGKSGFDGVSTMLLTDSSATVGNIRELRGFLEKAGAADTVVLFIAGHGVHDKDADATYYFITHDTKVSALASTALPFAELEGLVAGIASRNKVILMDTCASGELDEEALAAAFDGSGARGIIPRTVRGLAVQGAKAASPGIKLNRNRMIFDDFRRRTGAVVFSSSRGNEFSYESDAAKGGLFTYAIKQGLAGDADSNRNGQVDIRELIRYVAVRVPASCNDLQHPVVDRDNPWVGVSFPVRK